MAARLGEVLYWAASLIAVLILGIVAYGALFGGGRAEPFALVVFVGGAVAVWLIGIACRYVLAGGNRSD